LELASPRHSPLRARPSVPRRSAVARHRRVSLCETLDRVLNKGAVIAGDVIISVADIDLIYLGVNLVITSVETLRNWDSDRRSTRDMGVAGTQPGVVAVPKVPFATQRAEV